MIEGMRKAHDNLVSQLLEHYAGGRVLLKDGGTVLRPIS